jgi:uncharacterized protein YkwD
VQIFKRLVVGTVIAAVASTLAPTVTAHATTSGCFHFHTAEKEFARKTNLARRAAGVGALHLDRQLTRVARKHTRTMDKLNRLFHTPATKLRRRVTHWIVLGENVGVGGDVVSLQRAFMASPEHRANIMYTRFNYVGVGVRKTDTQMWVTVVFESRKDPGTTLPPPC